MEANILKQIFFDHHGHWDTFVKKYGKLQIKYAACTKSKAVLKRMIRDLTRIEETKGYQEKEEVARIHGQVSRREERRELRVS